MQFWRTKQFQALSKTWELNLKRCGFQDAEVSLKGDRALKQRATNSYRQASELERDTRLEYYRILGQLTNETKFKNELEKKIMVMHADGHTIKEIVEGLHISRDRKTIRYIIRRWQMKWGIRNWSLSQMNLKKTAIG